MKVAVVKPGETLEGRYKILKAIDEGGMGSVFLAEHVLIKRKLAVKVLRPELATDADVVERFMNEARAAGTLGHPNIVESTDMGFTRDGVPYIVFEFLEGSLLTDEVYRLGGLTVRRALRIGAQIASALHAAHNAGIIHRDLKSENVFLTHKEDVTDHVKVLDFGISRFLEAEAERSAPGGQVMGTPEFMAPEQITDPDNVDKRCDIYALGVIMYEMLTAKRPFRNDNDPHAVLHQVLHELPPPLDIPNAPPGLLVMITEKMLAKDRKDRYDSMKEVQGALEAFNTVTTPTPVSITVPKELSEGRPAAQTPRPLTRPGTRQRSLWPIAAVLGVALLGGGAFLLTRKGSNAAAGTTPVDDGSAVKKQVIDDAAKLGSLLESEARGAKLRAEGIAGTPMLRAAIETDAATLHDMVTGKDLLFEPAKGEVLAVFQTQGGGLVPMVRVPESAPEIAPLDAGKTRIESDGTHLFITASVAIQKQSSGVGGVVVISETIDLSTLQRDFAHYTRATLAGLTKPLVIMNGPDDPSHVVSAPVPGSKDLGGTELTLQAVHKR